MDTPSIRSSGNKGKSGFRAIHIEEALLEKAKHFLESYQFDLRIRQPLHDDKMEQSIGKHKYYVLGTEQKYEPGYILVMKGLPVVFLQGRLQYGFTLRLRLHSSLYANEGIFVGTLDTIQSSLRLEDVLMYEGNLLNQEPYSKRYATLRTFFDTAFVQDTRLSGVTVSIADISPLSKLISLVDSKQFHTIEFIPEQGGRRRLFFHVPTGQPPVPCKPVTTPPKPVSNEERTVAIAYKIKGLPDTYELKDTYGTALGKAAVQTTDISQILRQTVGQDGKKVKIQWYEEFQRFKIIGLLE